MFCADGEFGAEIYSGATSEKQALEVFTPAKLMMSRSPELASYMGVDVMAKSMIITENGSKFEPIIGSPGDGASPSCAVVDEYHEHDTPALYDTMETGMGAREQPLILAITTAGANIAGPCHEKHDEVCKVLDGVQENEELFGVIFGIDASDAWESPASLVKANPNYGISVDADFLLAQQRQALQNPLQQNKFKTKHLNVWTSVMAGVMNMQQWALCADALMDEEEFAGSDCWVGTDLASKSDLCSSQRLYRRILNGRAHYYLFGTYWLPESAIDEPGPNQAHYRKWVNTGALIQTDGATVDFELITETIIGICKRINPIEAVFDPFNAVQMMQSLMASGIEAVEFTQTPANFAVPMDELLTAVKDGRFHHDGNEMTTWCMSNMVARVARKGLMAPVKQKPHQKIDGAIATIMAIARATAGKKQEEFVYAGMG
jgi:phage terminase large subunit-like protein